MSSYPQGYLSTRVSPLAGSGKFIDSACGSDLQSSELFGEPPHVALREDKTYLFFPSAFSALILLSALTPVR